MDRKMSDLQVTQIGDKSAEHNLISGYDSTWDTWEITWEVAIKYNLSNSLFKNIRKFVILPSFS
jgi:hypothetical protein